MDILRMIYHCAHPLTLATSHQYKPFVPSNMVCHCVKQILPEAPETLSRRGMLLALAARASAYPKSRTLDLWTQPNPQPHNTNLQALIIVDQHLGIFLNIFWNPRTQTSIHIKTIKFPDFFLGVPKPFLDDMRKEWPHGTSAAMSSIQLSGRPAASLAAHAGAI